MTLFANLRILTASAGVAALMATASPSLAAPSIEKTVRVAPGGLYELVFNSATNDVYVAATRTLEKVYTVKANRMAGLGIDPVAERLFVTSMNDDLIVAIDAKTGAEIGRWASGGDVPINVVADNASKRLFVTNQGDGVLTVLNSETGALLGKIATGSGALGVAFNPRLNQAYVSNRNAGTTTVVNTADYSVIANLETGTLPQTVTIDHATNLVYVSNKARGGRVQPGGPPPAVDERGDTVAVIRP